MKIIELLNRIADNEDIPYRIYYDGNVYEYDGETQNYCRPINCTLDFLIGEDITALLNDKVEIIEEPKKIKKIPLPSFDEFKKMSAEERYIITAKEYDLLDELIDEINNLKEK